MFQLPILIAVAILTANLSSAQPQRTEIKEFVQASETVVEGEVFTQECFIDETSGNIRTANFVRVKTPIKGYAAEAVVIYTDGGQLGDRVQTVSHSANFGQGRKGFSSCIAATRQLTKATQALYLKGETWD